MIIMSAWLLKKLTKIDKKYQSLSHQKMGTREEELFLDVKKCDLLFTYNYSKIHIFLVRESHHSF